jgi:dTDP-glucose 4,6-dehydratase
MPSQKRAVRNVLVTGGAGFIGSAFIRHLLSPKVQFKGTCINYDLLTYAGNLDNLTEVASDPRYTFVQGNICDQQRVADVCDRYGIDTIIHFAAESHVDRSIQGPEGFMQTNIMGTFHLLEVVRKNPTIHFHHVSTDEVYGSLGSSGLFTENSPYQPNSPYSASKAASDHLVRAYTHTYHISTCLSNCSNNYGPYQYPEKLIPLMILNCMKRMPLPIYGKGDNVRDWLYVDDHAEALWLLLTDGVSGETYNIGGSAEKRNIDLVYEMIDLMAPLQRAAVKDLQELVIFVPDRPGHDQRYAIDASKIQNELGWKPRHTFVEGLQKTIAWYFNQRAWLQTLVAAQN